METTPFTIIGDEPIEARIVAWVLGEASAFEAGELERLCAERPEFLVFRRRMVALHGLMREAETVLPDDGWKLPPEKRKVLEDLLGNDALERQETARDRRVRRTGIRALLAIAACLVLTIVVLRLTGPFREVQSARMAYAPEKYVDFMPPAGTGKAVQDEAAMTGEREMKRGIDIVGGSRFTLRELESKKSENTLADAPAAQYANPTEEKPGESVEAAGGESNGLPALAGRMEPQNAPKPAAPVVSRRMMAEGVNRAKDVPESSDKFSDMSEGASSAPGDSTGGALAKSGAAGGMGGKGRGAGSGTGFGNQGAQSMQYRNVDGLDAAEKDNQSSALASNARPSYDRLDQNMPSAGGLADGGSSAKDFDGYVQLGQPILDRGLDTRASVDPALKAIRDQEDKVEERRKVLATVTNTKGIIHKGEKTQAKEEAIRRSFDESDYAEAKKDLEKEMEVLKEMKVRQIESKLKAIESDQPLKLEKPRIDPSVLEEIPAAEQPYSTFSLNVSDASFKIAQAALARGERPDPAGVKVEQFYNAVDYGDPSPASGEPVAVKVEQAAHPVVTGRTLVRIAMKTAAEGRAASQPLHLTLLVDQSGSMVREDRREAMDKALAGLAGLLTENDRVSVVGFSRTPRLLADRMPGNQAGNLSNLVNQSASEGGTNLEEAVKLAGQVAARDKQPGAQSRIVLFTDGAANLGDADPLRLAEKVKALRQNGISFDIAGIAADDLNDDLLAELARNGNGRYTVCGKGDGGDFGKQLAGAFRPAAENVKVQVRFNSGRVGRYRLIGFEKDRLKTEDFRNDAVDAAELAAEEAGVAIYQVETLPGGTGEIGEVSVRFRDTASGSMVERTWTIPHDSGTQAVDRAAPSMQLAVLSMLAAEKLRGGPLGDAVDFKQLSQVRSNVRKVYGTSGRSAEMLRLIDALK